MGSIRKDNYNEAVEGFSKAFNSLLVLFNGVHHHYHYHNHYHHGFCLAKTHEGTREMALWLRAVACLLEDLGLISNAHKWFTTSYNLSSRGSETLFLFPLAQGIYVVHKYTYKQNTYKHKIII